jgi:MFS family permease
LRDNRERDGGDIQGLTGATTSRSLRTREFRALLGARFTNSLATTALATVVGFQVWELTHDPLALGLLGLVEAIPALGLMLFGGHVADRRDRRSIILITSSLATIAAVLLGVIALDAARLGLLPILGAIFVIGVAAGFERPALFAFEMQVIPIEHAAKGGAWLSSTSQTGAIIGPAVGGLLVAAVGVPTTYLLLAVVLAASTMCVALVARKPMPVPEAGERLLASLASGIRFVFRNQSLVGAMALDLFAVFFGGAIALLPIFADEILHVGPVGLGLLRTAPSIGALLMMVVATRRPPTRYAGPILLACVAGFGVSMIVFAISTNFALSMAALFMSGATDGISVVIRGLILRVMAPENMRGRVSAVNWVFVGASNEIGALESGIAARLLGPATAVLAGGFVTLLVVAGVVLVAPELRRLDLRARLTAQAAGEPPG